MPLYIQNANEVHNEDDTPLPANTTSYGSVYDNSQAVECGNRVLELLEKHKKEVQSRMAATDHGFRVMLEKNGAQGSHTYGGTGIGEEERMALERSKIVDLYNSAVVGDKGKHRSPHEVKVSVTTPPNSGRSPTQNPKNARSDEYFDPPLTATEGNTARKRVLVNSNPKGNSFCYDAPLPLARSRVNDSILYEPDKAVEICDGCSNNDVSNANAPTNVTRVQFQLPGEINSDQDETFEDDTDPEAPRSSRRDPMRPQPSTTSTTSRHRRDKNASKHGITASHSTISQERVPVASMGGAPSDHGLTSRSNTPSGTSLWSQLQEHITNNFWSFIILVIMILVCISWFLTTMSAPAESYDTIDKPKLFDYRGPVM